MREIMPKELKRQTMNTLGFWIVKWSGLVGGAMVSRGSAEMIKFDVAGGLDDFEFAKTGDGKSGEWSIVRSDSGQALAQTSTDTTDNRFPLAIYRPFSRRDVDVSTRFLPVAGKVDQAGGIVIRLTSANDYYVVRANALEDNVRFYRLGAALRVKVAAAQADSVPPPWPAP